MKSSLIGVYWHYLLWRQKRLIPEAYFDEKKRIKLCLIDEKIITLKEKMK